MKDSNDVRYKYNKDIKIKHPSDAGVKSIGGDQSSRFILPRCFLTLSIWYLVMFGL